MARDSQELDAELRDLWSRRQDLDTRGWERLYQIVTGILMPCRPKELKGLPLSRESYVLQYFEDKVFPLDKLKIPDHAGALQKWYTNYLRDQIDKVNSIKKWEVPDTYDDDGEHKSRISGSAQPVAETPDYLDALEEAGFSGTDIHASARCWLASSEEWVRDYLTKSYCPDGEHSEPLIDLAKRMGIKSYAYKAEKLGFNWKNPGDYVGFTDTLLGRWIVSLGIEILPDNIQLIHAALKILCFEALSWVDQQGPEI